MRFQLVGLGVAAFVLLGLFGCGSDDQAGELGDLRATVKALQTESVPATEHATPTREPTVVECGLQRVTQASQAVVAVETDEVSGTAFFIDGTHLLTNRHVVGAANRLTVEFQSGNQSQAAVVAVSDRLDLALLRVANESANVMVWGRTERLQAGQDVYAVGYPFGTRGLPVVTKGGGLALRDQWDRVAGANRCSAQSGEQWRTAGHILRGSSRGEHPEAHGS